MRSIPSARFSRSTWRPIMGSPASGLSTFPGSRLELIRACRIASMGLEFQQPVADGVLLGAVMREVLGQGVAAQLHGPHEARGRVTLAHPVLHRRDGGVPHAVPDRGVD